MDVWGRPVACCSLALAMGGCLDCGPMSAHFAVCEGIATIGYVCGCRAVLYRILVLSLSAVSYLGRFDSKEL